MKLKNNRSALAGMMITAGCAIGAGMFSLPVTASGMWFPLSIICLLFLWFINYLAAIYFLELNTHFAPGASFNTITSHILGKTWNVLIGLSIAFLLYILLYAYYSAFGSMMQQNLGLDFGQNQWAKGALSLLMGSILAAVIWASTATVGYVSTILVAGMVIAFVVSMSGYAFHVELKNLLDLGREEPHYVKYIWAGLPYFMTSFGFVTVVPSLYKFYGKDKRRFIKKGLLFGSLIAFAVYIFFLFVTFGNISRSDFVAINASGGNIGQLVAAFEDGTDAGINFTLSLFSNFAIISSFLGVGIGLFDFVADRFSFPDDRLGRFKSAVITFLPSGLASFFFPNGFIFAIGFAGLVVVFSFIVATYFMVRKTRRDYSEPAFKVWGGSGLLSLFLSSGVIIAICQILRMLDYLPKW